MRYFFWASVTLALLVPATAQAQLFRQRGCIVVPPCVEVSPTPAPVKEPTPKKEETKPAPEPLPPPALPPDTAAETGVTLSLFDSSVGYIDPAIPMGVIRLRFDTAYDANRPTRAEFFYPRTVSPGLPMREKRIDYQELSAYVEAPVRPWFSGFIEVPMRFINPELNDNSAGLGDLNFGFKYAFQYEDCRVTTFQLRTYVPTGDGDRGLGTDHVSIEPALLAYRQLSDRWRVEGELRYWQSIGGTDFAGSLVRYGVGVSYGERPPDRFWLTPVAEVVGWTVFYGKETALVTPTFFSINDAAGDTIVNLKVGLRAGLGNRADIYAGYGRPLTGEIWYENIYRVEFRLLF